MQSNTEKYHKNRNIPKTTQKNRKQNRPHPKEESRNIRNHEAEQVFELYK